MEKVTDIVAKYAIKHIETRWQVTKYVASRVMEQWGNLYEYSLAFLPEQKNFKNMVA